MPSAPRNKAGQFTPGHSGNPAGRPATQAVLRDAARCHSLAAIEIVARVLHDDAIPLRTRFIAARTLLQAVGSDPKPETKEQKRRRRIHNVLERQSAQALERLLHGQVPLQD